MYIQIHLQRKNLESSGFKKRLKHLLLAVLLTGAAAVTADDAPLETQYSLSQAVSQSLAQHPELMSFVHRQNAAQAMVTQMSAKTPYTIKVEVEDLMGTGKFSNINAMQTQLSIAWLIEGDVLLSKASLAKAQSKRVNVNKEIKALDIAANTSKIFIVLLSQKEQLLLAKQAEKQSEDALREIDKRVQAGQANIVDQLRAKAALSKKSLVVEDLLHEIEASKAELAAQWQGLNFSSEQVTSHDALAFDVKGSLLRIPTTLDIDKALAKITNNPAVKLFATEQRIAQSEISLARVTNKPAWQVITGIKRNEAVDDYAFTAGISIPFGSENRNRGKIAAMEAEQQALQADSDAWFSQLATQVLLLGHKLKHNRHVISGLEQETIPLLEDANQKAANAYQIGRYSYSDWYSVQQELLATKAELIDAYTNIHIFTIELERLTGAALTGL